MLKEELDIIHQAVLNELEGQQFYTMASYRAPDSDTKEALLELANEEGKHLDYLIALGKKLEGKAVEVEEVQMSDIPSPGIFRWGKAGGEYMDMALSVFSIGMDMEMKSIEFYKNAREKFESKSGKDLFDVLIEWEKLHLDQFTKEYSLLKEEWWAKQRFSPLD
ncbi:MAG: ferritin family protein [Clostridiaceae bacterium]